MKITLTPEQIAEIKKAYEDPTIRVSDIAEVYGITRGHVVKVATTAGAAYRRPKATKGVRGEKKSKVCPKCHKSVSVEGAQYCCFCGTDIRNPKELLIARIHSIMGKLKLLPEDTRDEMHKLLIDIRTELSKE